MKSKSPDVKSIFAEMLTLTDESEREGYLDRVCGDDADLRAEIVSLIQAYEQAEDFLSSEDLRHAVTNGNDPSSVVTGTKIGRYKILEKLGEGGMAIVYMAEQDRPIRRQVALKLIKQGMDTREVIARFEAERQALAMMEHPNIAKVLDAGTTESGRPYFVMELVRGLPITDFCDKNHLTTHKRLELFISVCHAVRHAHQKGIIHRDLKPTNILVTLHDTQPVVKVIDFGIAKALNQRLTEKTLFTHYAQMVGTPEYMSPEQAEMSGLDIDTRSDVFALGVLLYELLTGSTPFDSEYLLSKGYAELQRIIREEEPVKPSTRISTLGEALTEVAKHRRTTPELLRKLIRSDLDWIVMKTQEKDRNRRYESVSELAADIKRHLEHEPVLAGRPSCVYKLKKFVQRNRALVAASLVTVLILIVAGAGISAARLRAREAGLRAEGVFGVLETIFDLTIPELLQGGHEQAVRQFLESSDNAAAQLRRTPTSEALIRRRIAEAFRDIGDLQSGDNQYELALEVLDRAGVAGWSSLSLLTLRRMPKDVLDDPARYDKFLEAGRQALARVPADLSVASFVLSRLTAYHYEQSGTTEQAESFAQEFQERIPNDPAYDQDRLRILYSRCMARIMQNAWPEAAEALREAIHLLPTMTSKGGFTTKEDILRMYARAAAKNKDLDQFERDIQDLLQRLPVEEPYVRNAASAALGEAYARFGRWDEGYQLLKTAALAEGCSIKNWFSATFTAKFLGKRDDYHMLCIEGLGRYKGGAMERTSYWLFKAFCDPWSGVSDYPLMEELSNKALEQQWSHLRPYHLNSLARWHYNQGNYAEAKRYISEFLERVEKDRNVYPFDGYYRQVMILARLGDLEQAKAVCRKRKLWFTPRIKSPGQPVDGRQWDTEVWKEMGRLEALALMRELGLVTKDGFDLIQD